MGVAKDYNIRVRIKNTSPLSPIAVFRHPDHGKLEAVFANTVKTQERIRNRPWELVGVYHRDSYWQQMAIDMKAAALEVQKRAA